MRKRIKNLLWIAKDFHLWLYRLCSMDWAGQVPEDVLRSRCIQARKSCCYFISYSFVLQLQEFGISSLQLQQDQHHRHSNAHFVWLVPKGRRTILGYHHSILINRTHRHPHRHKRSFIYEKPSQNHQELSSWSNDSTELQHNHSRVLLHHGCLLPQHAPSAEYEPSWEQLEPRSFLQSAWEVLT